MAEKDSTKHRAKLIEKALDDPTFRQRLIQDPRGAISSELGIEIPAGIEVKVVEETANTIYIVLPSQPESSSSGKSASPSLSALDDPVPTSCNTQDLCTSKARRV
jgi:hypothetical protein